MAKNKKKTHSRAAPVEKHDTAAWADREKLKKDSQVNQPSEKEIRNAKEYADSNQK
ncbi:MAG: DUF3787 domain-containing protein [Firmicutes bacterium]|nr:DUF3787 domain-containing protein [Bacillota bacterium]